MFPYIQVSLSLAENALNCRMDNMETCNKRKTNKIVNGHKRFIVWKFIDGSRYLKIAITRHSNGSFPTIFTKSPSEVPTFVFLFPYRVFWSGYPPFSRFRLYFITKMYTFTFQMMGNTAKRKYGS